MRLSEARLQAESSTCIYSLHGLLALMRPESGDVCHWLIVVSYCTPGSAHCHAASAMSRMSSRAGIGSPTGSPVLRAMRCQSSSFSTARMNVVGQAHRVVGVLVLDRDEALTVDRHVEAGVAQRVGLLLLLGLAPDELADVRVVDVEDDHLRRAARLAAGLDRARPGVGAAHEGDRARGGAALGQRLHRAADVREVDARARAAEEDLALVACSSRGSTPSCPRRRG